VREETYTPKTQTQPNQIDGEGADGTFEDFPFTVTDADMAKGLRVRLAADVPIDDYDLTLFFRESGVLKEAGSSGSAPGMDEEILLEAPKVGEYVLRVTNYLAFNGYTVTVTRLGQGADTVRPRTATESWTLTCQAGGKVLASQKVVVERGQTLAVKEPCGANAAQVVAAATGKPVPGTPAPTCATSAGFASVRLDILGRRKVRFGFARLAPNPVTIEVFQTSSGSRILSRRVATFSKLSKSHTFAPKQLADGVYFARYSIKGLKARVDQRRVTFAVRGGIVTRRPVHHRPESCGLLSAAKLENPVFGGTSRRPLRIALLTAQRANVTVQVR
ncbi:MAG: cpt, partial [Solirubrobacterales bacterium]|nr:cpt [Solirubrobacterales bacterium]